jgi:PKD repeat protein
VKLKMNMKNIFKKRYLIVIVMLSIVILGGLGLYNYYNNNASKSAGVTDPTTGTNFNHIIIIAMENEPESIIGSSSTPFLNSLAAAGSTLANDNHYSDNVNCSAGCYVEFTTGAANGDGLGDGWGCCVALTSVVDQMAPAGLTWQAYCAEGCPRGLDHFPFQGYSSDTNSPNIYGIGSGPNGGISVTTSTFIAEANSANPPNYMWYTPTDSENMHDNSISSGDTYLKNFLVGSGTVSSPASGSLLASNLFTNPTDKTLLWIWWDECGSSDGGPACNSNSSAANIEYGSMVKAGYTSSVSYNEFSELATIEDNWGLSLLGSAASNAPISDIFTSVVTPPTSGNFGICTSLPQGWNCGNANGQGGSASSTINNGIELDSMSSVGGSNNAYGYATTQKGTFPWTPCTSPASGVLPAGITTVTTTFTPTVLPTSTSGSRYHIYLALYYWLPNGTVSAGGSTYQCLDTQARIENIGGTFSPIGTTATYNPGDSFGWDQVVLGSVSTGLTYSITANVTTQAQSDFAAWGIPTSTAYQLSGIEIGIEGFSFNQLNVSFTDVNWTTSSSPSPSFTLTANPASISVQTGVQGTSAITVNPLNGFTGTVTFGVTSSTGLNCSISSSTLSCSSSTAGTYTATVTGTSGTLTSQVLVSYTVTAPPTLTALFIFSPSAPTVGQTITFTATASGGTSPYAYSWTLGDGTIASGASITHSYSTTGIYTVTLTITDSSNPTQTATSSHSITVSTTPVTTGKYILSLQGWDFDGGGEHTAILNGHTIGKLPPSNCSSCAQTWTTFTINITTTISTTGLNTLSFKDAGWDCGVTDQIRDLTITSGSTVVYSNATTYDNSCTINPTLIYHFRVGPPPPPSFTLSANPTSISIYTGKIGNSTITIVPVNGFSGVVTYTIGVSSSNLLCSITSNILSCTSNTGGVYTATVTGTSGTLTSSTSVVYTVTQPSPLVVTVVAGYTVTFTATVTGGVSPYTYAWSFGDGTTDIRNPVSHSYTTAGTYTVTLTVTDSIGETITITQSITV